MFQNKILYILMLFASLTAWSQQEDFRTWISGEVQGELFDLIDFSVVPELRFYNNSSTLGGIVGETDMSVPLTKFLRLGGIYRYTAGIQHDDRVINAHRFGAYCKLDEKLWRLKFNYRAMYEEEYIAINTSADGHIPQTTHRHKLGVDFNGKGWDITPGIAAEGFFTIHPVRINYQKKLRLTFSVEYKVNKDLDLNFAYKYQQEFYENNPLTSHILCFGFSYEL